MCVIVNFFLVAKDNDAKIRQQNIFFQKSKIEKVSIWASTSELSLK